MDDAGFEGGGEDDQGLGLIGGVDEDEGDAGALVFAEFEGNVVADEGVVGDEGDEIGGFF